MLAASYLKQDNLPRLKMSADLKSLQPWAFAVCRFEPSEEVLDSILEFCSVLAQNFANSQPGKSSCAIHMSDNQLPELHAGFDLLSKALFAFARDVSFSCDVKKQRIQTELSDHLSSVRSRLYSLEPCTCFM